MKYPFASDAYIMLPSVFYHWGEDDFPARQDVQLLTGRRVPDPRRAVGAAGHHERTVWANRDRVHGT